MAPLFLARFFGAFYSFLSAHLEFFNTPGGINDLFRSRVERVAGAADFNALLFPGRTNSINRPARTGNDGIRVIRWMNICLHVVPILTEKIPSRKPR